MSDTGDATTRRSLEVAVVIIPLPAQGHLNQLLHLSHLLAARCLPVHYISTATHLRQATNRLHAASAAAAPAALQFHEFPIPNFDSPIPNPNPRPNKFPTHLQPLFSAAAHLRHPVAALLRHLSATARRVAVIHDSLMSSVVRDVAAIPNVESYIFHSISAFSTFWFFNDSVAGGTVPAGERLLRSKMPPFDDCFSPEFEKLVNSEMQHFGIKSGDLYNTCRIAEGRFLQLIQELFPDQISWAIGPFNPIKIKPNGPNGPPRDDCLKWLDMHEENSVIYVAFGTTVSFSDEEIAELAVGLEQSGVKFIWIVRDADRGDLSNGSRNPNLPLGFEERVKERGVVIRDWAPQLAILGHSAIGGFMSHCGWNSCMESISMGVPIAAWPMHSDRPWNAVLVTDVLGIGLSVRDWMERDRVVGAGQVLEAVRRLMQMEEGKKMRIQAKELGRVVREAVTAKDGATRREMDAFIAHIKRA